MQFKIQKKENENVHKYPTEYVELAKDFSDIVEEELADFLLGVVLFGSTVRKQATTKSDIDVLVLTDDVSYALTEGLVEGYRIIVENAMLRVSPKLHVTSMTFSSFWEYIKASDPVAVNILRDGISLMDKGFFSPLQQLLRQGRIRPSEESVWRYFGRSQKTLLNSRWHVLQATLDLYWTVIDAAHAALMRKNEVPPTPDHVAEMLEKVFVRPRLLEKKYVETMQKFYKLSKMITHREIQEVKGAEYERYYQEADEFVRRMKRLIERGKV